MFDVAVVHVHGQSHRQALLVGALDDVDAVVTGPSPAAYVGRHPEYADLVVDA